MVKNKYALVSRTILGDLRCLRMQLYFFFVHPHYEIETQSCGRRGEIHGLLEDTRQ